MVACALVIGREQLFELNFPSIQTIFPLHKDVFISFLKIALLASGHQGEH